MLENLQYIAGVLFYALADLILGMVWVAIVAVILYAIFRGSGRD